MASPQASRRGGLPRCLCWQVLGNGRRAYNTLLMRFHSPDDMSPFHKGGVNAYAYCGGDPVNRNDPSGRYFLWVAMGAGVAALAAGAGALHLADERDKPRVALTAAIGLAVSTLAFIPAAAMSGLRHTTPTLMTVPPSRGVPFLPHRAQLRSNAVPVRRGDPTLVQGRVVNQSSARKPLERTAVVVSSPSPSDAAGAAASMAFQAKRGVSFKDAIEVMGPHRWSRLKREIRRARSASYPAIPEDDAPRKP